MREIRAFAYAAQQGLDVRSEPSLPVRVLSSISAKFRETSVERRAFLKLLCIGAGVVAAGAPAEALTSFMPLAEPSHDPDLAPQPGVATSKDMERAQVEKAWYGHWRRVNRRHWRRVNRRWRRVNRRHWRRVRRGYYY